MQLEKNRVEMQPCPVYFPTIDIKVKTDILKKSLKRVGEEVHNYLFKFSVLGIKFYKNSNDGRWYFQRKNNNMRRLM